MTFSRRARGGNHSKFSDFTSTLDFVEHVHSLNLDWERRRGGFDTYPNFRALWEKWSPKRPITRTRFQGLVGPEPDYSAREADVPRKLVWRLAADAGIPGEFFRCKPDVGRGPVIASHDCIGSFGWTDKQVEVWTTLAHKAGVLYSGKRGYQLPRKYQGYTPDTFSFQEKKLMGLIPQHKRSTIAKLRRSARRGAREAVLQPLTLDAMLTTRRSMSARHVRTLWFNQSPERRVPFSQFREGVAPPVLTLSLKGCRFPVKQETLQLLKRLLSRSTKVLRQAEFLGLKEPLRVPIPDLKPDIHLPRKIKAGSLVLSYQHSLERDGPIPPIVHSTIPLVDSSWHPELDWRPDPGRYDQSFARVKTDIDFSSW